MPLLSRATSPFRVRRSAPAQTLEGGRWNAGTLELNGAGGPNTSVLVLSGAAKRDAATKRKPHVPKSKRIVTQVTQVTPKFLYYF